TELLRLRKTRFGWQRACMMVLRGIGKAREQERLPALDACAALAAVDFTARIARPGFRIIDAEFMPAPRDVGFRHRYEGTDQFDPGVGAQADRLRHRLHEFLPAIG